jgi:protein associated with RNAse G/E
MFESSLKEGGTEASEIVVRSCKHDGRVSRMWPARIARLEDSLIVLEAFFAEEIRHALIGTIEAGTLSTEYFWTDRWYSIFRFQTPDGKLLKFYCNVNTPPTLESGALTFVDLDVDVLVQPDYSFEVLDEDEFERHAELYQYPAVYRSNVQEALDELRHLIENRQFPFNDERPPSSNVEREA